ncbi:TrmB family transcriptional regulator [bacterium]|nr:TrmB family transcriptional regulator [bacterium]
MDNIVEKLKELGFNSYEAKVYLALLKKYPTTGYEIAQTANIPQSRAYDALKSLVSEQIVIPDDNKPQKYSPISPKELTKRFKRKINSTIDYLEKRLPEVKENYNEPVHNIEGYDVILEKTKELINNSQRSLYIEIWEEDFKHLDKEIEAAYDRGVDIKIVAYGKIKTQFGTVYYHNWANDIEQTIGRLICILADNKEGIFGKIEKDAIWTENAKITFLLKEFMVHDMYLLDVGLNFPEQLKYFYGPGFKKLKDKILAKDSKYNIH